jgi:hypothetical protein
MGETSQGGHAKEAVELWGGKRINVEGVKVEIGKNDRLAVRLPEGLTGPQLKEWLARNKKRMEYETIGGDEGFVPPDEAGSPYKKHKEEEDTPKPHVE